MDYEHFETGSRRDSRVGKGRFDLITPFGLRRLAERYEAGGERYGDRNWEKGQPVTRLFDSAMRHMVQRISGDTSEDHIAAAAWNLFAIMHMEEVVGLGALPEGLIDWPVYREDHGNTAEEGGGARRGPGRDEGGSANREFQTQL